MRVQRSPPLISHPVAAELAPLSSSSLASPPTTPPRGHKHSLSKPMSWLGRSATSTSLPHPRHQAQKPVRISEPKFDNSLEIFNIKRGSPLGSGAIVVRTPQEALCGSQVSQLFGSLEEEENEQQRTIDLVDENESRILPPPPGSPPLPPLPAEEDSPLRSGSDPASNSTLSLPLQQLPLPRPSRPPPPISDAMTPRRPSLKHNRESADIVPPVPSLPENIPPIPPQPPFEAVLLSAVPDGAVDPVKIIVTLETCMTTYRTTLRTLTSRPSHLSKYIVSLLSHGSETASVYSHVSEAASAIHHDNAFSAAFHDHLTSVGCLSQSSSSLHIFLDRPSAPYSHILTYLRSSPENPETLPRAAALLGSASRARLEALLELRDEASYLGLDELYKLCTHEINQRHSIFGHSSNASSSAMSIRSLHTVIEQNPSVQGSRLSQMSNGTSKSGALSSVPHHLALRERSASRTPSESGGGSKLPPPGWI